MIETNLLKNLLLISNPKVLGLSEYLSHAALLFIMPAFYIGMIAEYFTNFDFKSVAKRAIVAFLAIKLFLPIHVEAVDLSLSASSKLLGQYSSHNKFLTAYQNASKVSNSNGGVWERLRSIVSIITNDPIVVFIFLLSYTSFFLLTQLYSLIYHLAIALFGFCAVLSIFPITSRSLTGAVYTSLWCVLMPFVVMIVLALIGDSDAFLKGYSGGIVQNLESLIQLLVMTILLLLTPVITTKIMNGTGINSVAENISQMAGMAALIGGSKIATNSTIGTGKSLGGGIHNVTTKPLMKSFRNNLSKRAEEITKQKGIGASLNSLKSEGFKDQIKNGLGDLREAHQKTDFKEKAILGADSLFNRRENHLAKIARSKDVASFVRGNSFNQNNINSNPKFPLSNYKAKARDFYQNSGSKKFSASNIATSKAFTNSGTVQRPVRPKNRMNIRPSPEGKFKFAQHQLRKTEGINGGNSAIQRRYS